jgi:heme o synthase
VTAAHRFKLYYQLAKPGIVYGNALSAIGGFLLAVGLERQISLSAGLGMLVGTSLVMAAGCVYNNFLDQGIDQKMARTKKRALVSGDISGRSALTYATVLGIIGFVILALLTNWLTVILGVIALVDYVILYGITKRRTIHGTAVGSISGSLPAVGGYTAMSGQLDVPALLLFLILACWQMPHFYAIAMFRFKDYAAAGLPVWPVKKGMRSTKIQILGYVAAFTIVGVLLTILGYTGYVYAGCIAALGIVWFWKGLKGFSSADDTKWAKGMFFYSLLVVMALPVLLAIGPWLP